MCNFYKLNDYKDAFFYVNCKSQSTILMYSNIEGKR